MSKNNNMSVWKEPRQKSRTSIFSGSPDPKFQSCILYPDDSHPHYQIYAKQWIKQEKPVPWHIAPEGWVELWPRKPLQADNWQEARKLQLSLMEQLVTDFSQINFDRRPATVECVELVQGAKGQRQARIYRYEDGPYEIQYFRYLPFGRDYIHDHYDICTFASSLDEARQSAQAELNSPN